jgi:hypothetical protein
MKLTNDHKPAREGDKLLLMVPNYWGTGATVREARKNVRLAGASDVRQWVLYSVHPKATVDEVVGALSSPIGHPAIRLAGSRK